jgi:dTDP-4-amino-4,6-dideoxygalactose transaminase
VKTLRILRDQGQSRKYHHALLGYNYRMDGLQGAVLGVKLRHLDRWNEARRRLAADYRARLAGSDLQVPDEMPYGRPAYHVFSVFSPRRDALAQHLTDAGVATAIHYPVPVHLQPAFAGLGVGPGALPVSERASLQTLSLPFYPELSASALERVTAAIHEFERAAPSLK